MEILRSLICALVLALLRLSAQESPTTAQRIVTSARAQIGVTTSYDPSYTTLSYPGGDVPQHTGVCSDVVVRSLRGVGIDLQRELHEDMKAHFKRYPHKWGLKKPDKNIDHRRVPNLMRYFERKHLALAEKLTSPESYASGDIVAWQLDNGLVHIGFVSDKKQKNVPLIIHNIGSGAKEENVLFAWKIIGHYRLKEPAPPKP